MSTAATAFLGPNPTIASISLGGSRDFYLKNKADGTKVEKFVLDDGDLLIMQGTTQSKWLHSIPKRAHALPRINLTFRRALNKAGTENYYRYNVGEGPVMNAGGERSCARAKPKMPAVRSTGLGTGRWWRPRRRRTRILGSSS